MTLTFDLIFISITRKHQNKKPHVVIFTNGEDIANNRKFRKKIKFNAKTRNLFFDEISRNVQTIYLRAYRSQKSHQILSLIIAFGEEDFFFFLLDFWVPRSQWPTYGSQVNHLRKLLAPQSREASWKISLKLAQGIQRRSRLWCMHALSCHKPTWLCQVS